MISCSPRHDDARMSPIVTYKPWARVSWVSFNRYFLQNNTFISDRALDSRPTEFYWRGQSPLLLGFTFSPERHINYNRVNKIYFDFMATCAKPPPFVVVRRRTFFSSCRVTRANLTIIGRCVLLPFILDSFSRG